MKLTSQQMINVAKRILKANCHKGMRVNLIAGVDEKGMPWRERAVFYNNGENFIGETSLIMNAVPGDM